MAAIYRIAELSTVKGTGALYALVHFFASEADATAGSPILLTNDFIMPALVDEVTQIAKDAEGRLRLTDGRALSREEIRALPPEEQRALVFLRETVKFPVREQIERNIEAYWQRAEAGKWTGDHTATARKAFMVDGKPQTKPRNRGVPRDNSDPKGLHARADVAALKAERQITERAR